MSGFANQIIGGLSKLIRPAIQSPNYAPSSAGWTINQDGSAEFNDATFRGTVVINSAGTAMLVYDGTPAAGNLILSLSAFAGTDAYGNNYPSGICTTNANGTASNAGYTSRWNPTDPLSGVQPLSLAFLNNVQCGLVSQLELIVQSATSDLVLEAGPASFLRALADNIFIGQAGGQPSKLQFSAGPNGGYYYEEVTLKSPAQTLVSGTVTQLDNLQEGLALYSDYGSAWNLATGVWTCPVTGPYDWNVVMGFLGAMANARCFARVCSVFNTAPFYVVDDVPISAGNLLSSTGTFYATAGTQYHVEVFQSAGANRQLDTSTSYIHIGRRL